MGSGRGQAAAAGAVQVGGGQHGTNRGCVRGALVGCMLVRLWRAEVKEYMQQLAAQVPLFTARHCLIHPVATPRVPATLYFVQRTRGTLSA